MLPAFKQRTPKPKEQSIEDCLLILLQGIQDHLVTSEGSAGEEFRTQLVALEKQFQGKENAPQLVAAAVEILKRYGTQASQAMARQKSGLVEAASELDGAVRALPALQAKAESWNRLEERIRSISSEDDLETVKARLGADVAQARAEALKEHTKISELVSGVAGKLEVVPTPPANETPRSIGAAFTPDALTGLPPRAFAETELRRALRQSSDSYLALFVVRRLALIGAKFGLPRGDQVVLKVMLYLSQTMPEYSLFRWSPNAFLTVAPPNTPYKELSSKVKVIEVTPMTPTLEWEGRSAMVPVALNCRAFSAKDFGTPYELFRVLDKLSAEG
jgi:GGDEF domain-containing protein